MDPLRMGMMRQEGGGQPYVEIIEQPASRAVRFRYECEGRSAGSVPGANSCPEAKTYPTIKINNYQGRGIVLVSCVMKDRPHRPHPHNLVGRETCKSGVCHVELTPGNPVVSFANLGIQCVKRKDIEDSLKVREEIRVDPFKTGFEHKSESSSIDVNSLRLCFQVFIEGRDGKINLPLKPIVSEPIYDKKAIGDLVICKLSHYSASVAGGLEMIVLTEKLAKEDIQVRFFEKRYDKDIWEGYGDFATMDVHKQVAISFLTPPYRYRRITEPLDVFVQLKRPSDGLTSEPVPFQFLPVAATEPESLKRKRRKFEENSVVNDILRKIQMESQAMMTTEPQFEFVSVNAPKKPEGNCVQALPVGTAAPYRNNVQALPVGTAAPYRNNVQALPAAPYRNNVQPMPMMPNRAGSTPSPLVDLFPYGQDSPGSLPSPATGYGGFDAPCLRNDQAIVNDDRSKATQNNRFFQSQNQAPNLRQFQYSIYPGYNQQQTNRQDPPVLQKLSIPQQAIQRNNVLQDDLASLTGTDIMDIIGHQQFSFDTGLNQLDSAELAAFGVNLSESFESGLSIT